MTDNVFQWGQVWATLKNVSWYKWTTFQNSGGDLAMWIDITDENNPQFCKALVRREDGLFFQNSLRCRKCVGDEFTRYKTRGFRVGYYFRGTDIFGTSYDGGGRYLPEPKN